MTKNSKGQNSDLFQHRWNNVLYNVSQKQDKIKLDYTYYLSLFMSIKLYTMV